MKCARCGHDSKKKDRVDGRCPSCKLAFAFDPNAGAPFSDLAFKGAIERVSSQGKVRWHPEHLYQELVRMKRGRSSFLTRLLGLGCVATIVTAVAFGLFTAVVGGVPAVFLAGGVGAGAFGLAVLMARSKPARLRRDEFDTLWRRWNDVHGPPAGLLAPPREPPRLTAELQAELEAYSFDRAVITDSRITADTLLANNFHFENNCAVLCEDGHPQASFEVVRRMLRTNPDLRVFALHDATPSGCGLAHRLSTDPEWFAGIGTVVDVGLRPAHARAMPHAVEDLPTPVPVAPSPRLTPAEAAWLAAHRLHLTAIRPEQLVKRLFRAMSAVDAGALSGTSDGGGVGDIGFFYIMGVDSSTSDGGGDSFG